MPLTRDSGFSLVEALIAMGLTVTVALGTAQLFSVAIAQNLAARDQTLMGLAAAAKIDDLAAAVAAGTIAATPADTLDRDADGCHDNVEQSGRTYARRWRIAEVPGFGANAYAIAVRVTPLAGGWELRLATVRRRGVP
jgi:type II secretory pathway pseudopilin PulG